MLERITEEINLVGTFSMYEPGNPQRADFDAAIEQAKQPGWVGSDVWTQLRDEDWIRVSNKIARIVLRKAEEIKKTGDEKEIKLMTARDHFANDIRYVVDLWLHRWAKETHETDKAAEATV
jgi:hypothetical protein